MLFCERTLYIHDSVHSPVNACDTKGNQARKLPLLEVTIYTNIQYAIHKYTNIHKRSITNYKKIIQTELPKKLAKIMREKSNHNIHDKTA